MNTITSPANYTDPKVPAPETTMQPAKYAFGQILAGCAVMFLILHGGALWLRSKIDPSWSSVTVALVMIGVAVLCNRWMLRARTGTAWRALGYGRVHFRAILVALIISAIMLAFFPIFTAITGTPISLKSNWLLILLAIVAYNGVAEETLFRGYVFGNLRKLGFSFKRAGFISMVIFATVHLMLFEQNPFIVGLLATLVALSYAFPFAYLFERGNNTIWAPVLLHVASHAVRLVDIPEAYYMTVVTFWIGMQIITPFLVYAFLGNLLKKQDS